MTTSVKVKVPESANWDAIVSIYDRTNDPLDSHREERVVHPGQEYEVHITDTRTVSVREVKLACPKGA